VTLGFGEIIRVAPQYRRGPRAVAGIPAWSRLARILIWVGITIAVAWNLTTDSAGALSRCAGQVAWRRSDTTRYKVMRS
jgi:hypothetical protein